MDELDFQSALHVLVHPNTGLAIRIVQCPGTELTDVALIVFQYTVYSLDISVAGGINYREWEKRFSFICRLLYLVSLSFRRKCGQFASQFIERFRSSSLNGAAGHSHKAADLMVRQF